jgi:hypothetical protein
MKFNSETVKRWSEMAKVYLEKKSLTVGDIQNGGEAWAIAHRSGISYEAYEDRTVTDAHIVTALKQVFPNAVFRDKYSY